MAIRRLRDSDPLTYTYKLDEDIEVDLLWKLFFKRHEEIFTTADFSRTKQALAEGEEIDCSKMFYVDILVGCESFVSKLLPSNDREEEKAAIRAIHMAIKSRPMRKLTLIYMGYFDNLFYMGGGKKPTPRLNLSFDFRQS